MYPSTTISPVLGQTLETQSYPEWNNFYPYNYQNTDSYYNYYQMYSYSNYIQNPNYYVFGNQQAQTIPPETTSQAKEELLKIQNKVNEKLNYTPSLEKSELSSASETESNVESNKDNDENLDKNNEKASMATNYPAFFTTQKMSNNTSKLSYTVYQLELLNAIYSDMKYPNSVQKTLIAKLIGITRDQVKIWFQNRRRKDTLVSQGKIPSSVVSKSQGLKRRKSGDEFDADEYSPLSPDQKKKVVENEVIDNVLYQLKCHQNAPSRLSTKRTKFSSIEQDTGNTSMTLPVAKNQMSEISQNKIIDISNIFRKDSMASVDKNDYSSNPSSFILTSSSSSSSSGVSSNEDDSYAYGKAAKFQVLDQPISIQDYVKQNYISSYQNMPKIHNPYQSQPDYNSTYPKQATKNQNWSANYQPYQPAYSDQTIQKDLSTGYYDSQVYDQSNPQYGFVQSNSSQVYAPYLANNLPYSYSL
ncbi:homeobox Hox-A2-like [Brachionus plicatilis]|uniref:Homeobox Hox-A2-like n=1 Tax=Brachionus plicatilis TaxID=10195 RepID=A0A3M7RM31_BRAPC|nr:homeobox Hox-A2-like [Brachionus plicatilis]